MINIMPELTPVFTAYEALVAEADAVFARVGEMHPDCVTCKPGCSDCCHAMFDLSLVEAMYLNARFIEKYDFGPERSRILENAGSVDRKLTRMKRDYFRELRDAKGSEDAMEHIMEEAAVTQKKGTHARLACNECHAPHNLLVKLPFKAQEGLRDFWGNITGKDVPHPVSLHTRDVVNANCKACHAQTNVNVASMDAKPYCVDCHRNVAHMRMRPISTRTVAYE